MRIESLYIDGFGHFAQHTFGPFDAPITIFEGENEAGKTTLLAFIRTILFGFPSRGRDEHYPPFKGGKHGGHIVVLDENGTRYTVERHAGVRGGILSVKDDSGNSYGEAELKQLVGHSSKELFENIFAFGLDELQEMKSLDNEEVQGRIYSAGLGVTDLPGVERKIEADREKIYRLGGNLGRNQSISEVLSELEEVEASLALHHQDAPRYAELTNQIVRLSDDIAGLEEARTEIYHALDHQRNLRTVRDDLVETGILEAKLSELPLSPNFPQDGIARLETVLDQVAKSEEATQQAADTVEKLKEVVSHPLAGEDLLEDAADIRKATSEKSRLDAAAKDLPERIGEANQQTAEVDRLVKELGPGWDSTRLEAIDISLPARDKVTQEKELAARLRQAVTTRQGERESAEKESTSADESTKQVAAEIERAGPSEYDETALTTRRGAISAARQGLVRLSEARQLQANLPSSGTSGASGLGKLPLFAAALLFAILGIGAAIWGFIGNGGVAAVVLAALGFVIGIGLAVFASRSGRSQGISSQPGDTGSQIVSIEQELSVAQKMLGLDSLDFAALEIAGGELEVSTRKWTEIQGLQRAHNDAVQESDRRKFDLERATEAFANSDEECAEAQDGWTEWLKVRDLVETMSADGVLELFSRVDAARSSLTNQRDRQQRVSAIESDIEEISGLVVPLATKHGVSIDIELSTTITPAIDELSHRLEEAQGESRQREADKASLTDAEDRLEQEKRQSQKAGDDLKELLLLADTDDTEEFRRIGAVHDEQQDYQNELGGHKTTILRVFGSEADQESLRAEIGDRSPVALDERVQETQQSLEEAELKRDGLREESVLAGNQLAELSTSDEASDLMAKRETLIEELRELGSQWSKYSLALMMLRKARNHHEEERQPQVIQTASEFFKDVTGGRYRGLRSPVGESVIIAVTEAGEERQASQLSRGTREQMYLSLRFGLVREFSLHTTSLPVIVDDALVNSDPRRARAAAEGFARLVDTNQVLVFTCHPEIAQQFQEACADAQIYKLESLPE
jgi:uncharacterized protein YhaN